MNKTAVGVKVYIVVSIILQLVLVASLVTVSVLGLVYYIRTSSQRAIVPNDEVTSIMPRNFSSTVLVTIGSKTYLQNWTVVESMKYVSSPNAGLGDDNITDSLNVLYNFEAGYQDVHYSENRCSRRTSTIERGSYDFMYKGEAKKTNITEMILLKRCTKFDAIRTDLMPFSFWRAEDGTICKIVDNDKQVVFESLQTENITLPAVPSVCTGFRRVQDSCYDCQAYLIAILNTLKESDTTKRPQCDKRYREAAAYIVGMLKQNRQAQIIVSQCCSFIGFCE